MKNLKKLATLTALGLLTLNTAYAQDLDSDGDGISDSVEIEKGTDPYISGYPTFEGVFFKDLKITNIFKNEQDERKDTEYSITPNGEGSVERNQTHFYETLLSLNPQVDTYRRLQIQNSKSLIYSSAIATEAQIHKIAQENEKLTKSGYLPKAITIEFNNDIKFKSNTYSKINSPVYNIFYQNGRNLIPIGKFLDRNVYLSGGEAKSVPMTVTITDPDIVAGLYESQSRYLVIQVDNLYFPEIGKTSEQMEQKMDKKTTAITVIKNKKVETFHVASTATDTFDMVLNYVMQDHELPSWKVFTASGKDVFALDYQIGHDNILLTKEAVTPLKLGSSSYKEVLVKQDDIFFQTKRLRDFAFIISDIRKIGNESVESTGVEKTCTKWGDRKPVDNKVIYKYLSYQPKTSSVDVANQANIQSFLSAQELTIGSSVYNVMDLVSKGYITYAPKNHNLELRATKEFLKVLDLETLEEVSLKLSNKGQIQNFSSGKQIAACTCDYRVNIHDGDFRIETRGCGQVHPDHQNTMTPVALEAVHIYNISLITY
jgi:hypothetical protein